VQALLSLQDVPFATFPSTGQVAEFPVQLSAKSHCPVDERHTVVAGRKASAGQLPDVPLQASATSQAPAAARQTVPLVRKASAGQVVEVPVHVSATSQAPFAARQTAPAFPAGCWHPTFVPSHWSFVHGLLSAVQAVPLGFFASAGQLADVPVHVSAKSHSPAAARHTVVDGWNPSAGQLTAVPLQVSATSQAPAETRQTVPLTSGVHVPRWPAKLHASHVPVLHAESQQIPFVQNPDAHWLFDEHPRPKLPSYKYAALETVLVDESPPATSTMFPLKSTACDPCRDPGIEGVAVQVDVPLNSSADDSVSLPVEEPPATSTKPLSTMLFGSSVIVAPTRALVIVPADDQLPFETEGSKEIAVLRTLEPFLPPVTRIFPLLFGTVTAVACSRGLEIEASVLNAFWTGS
jgi:hypothetical protein